MRYGVLGVAYLDALCTDLLCRAPVGITQDGGHSPLNEVGIIAAHELGHLLSFEHDYYSQGKDYALDIKYDYSSCCE